MSVWFEAIASCRQLCYSIRIPFKIGASVKILKVKLSAVIASLAFPALAHGACIEAPTWEEKPLTQSYIDGVEDKSERAHLRALLIAENSVRQRRQELKRTLMPDALIQHDGDRNALRKQLLAGTLLDVIQAIDVSKLKPRDYNAVIDAYWINGCTNKALQMLSKTQYIWTWQTYMPIAKGDAALLFQLAEREEVEFSKRKLRAFASILENPQAAVATMAEFLKFIEGNFNDDQFKAIDVTGLRIAISLAQGIAPSVDTPTLPQNPTETEQTLFYEEWKAIVAWASAAGHCQPVAKLTIDLLGLPSGALFRSRELLEASATRCFVLSEG